LYWNVVESFIVEKMSEYRMPGLSITVVRGSEVVYSRGFGYRDLDVLAPATPATIYGIGSITKSFTALSILMLAERGLLDVHDPFNSIEWILHHHGSCPLWKSLNSIEWILFH